MGSTRPARARGEIRCTQGYDRYRHDRARQRQWISRAQAEKLRFDESRGGQG